MLCAFSPALGSGLEKWSKEAEKEWWAQKNSQLSREVAHLLTPHRRLCRKRGVEVEVRIVRAKWVARTLLTEAASLKVGLLIIGQSGDTTT